MNRQENQIGVDHSIENQQTAEGLSVSMPKGVLMDGIDQVATVQPLL